MHFPIICLVKMFGTVGGKFVLVIQFKFDFNFFAEN